MDDLTKTKVSNDNMFRDARLCGVCLFIGLVIGLGLFVWVLTAL